MAARNGILDHLIQSLVVGQATLVNFTCEHLLRPWLVCHVVLLLSPHLLEPQLSVDGTLD